MNRSDTAGREAVDFETIVQSFEDAVFAQRPVEPGHYDDEYFIAPWREGDNRYDIETRRRIEGRNPALIKEVFEPRRTLDMGCGPGALTYRVSDPIPRGTGDVAAEDPPDGRGARLHRALDPP